MTRRWVLALAMLGGCAAELEPDPALLSEGPPRAEEALIMVRTRLGLGEWNVWWYGPQAKQCEPTGWIGPDGTCVDATTGSNGTIIYWDGVSEAHWTGLAHEGVHRKYGDPGHSDASLWGSDGPYTDWDAGSVVGDLNAALAADGM